MSKNEIAQAPEVLSGFLMYMQTIRGKSPRTVEQYYVDLRTFFRWLLQKRGLAPADADPRTVTLEKVDLALAGAVTLTELYEFLYYASDERKNNAATRARKVSCLRSFYKYLCETRGLLRENPTRNLDTPRKKKSLPKYLTLEDAMELLTHVESDYPERDACILTLFLNCGLRLSELCALNTDSIVGDRMTVLGKGNKERLLYLNDACQSARGA